MGKEKASGIPTYELVPTASSQTISFLFRGDRVPLVIGKGVLRREHFLPRSKVVPSPGIKIRQGLYGWCLSSFTA
ncbi:hypothetical protein BT93_L1607 [Corymbia citriodora subsp. variegata]|uniref:Uncharacterized protein n=1 Tax=Corymbia citriodora subsp. variegata TaxID=360336 RepID=A0A8T0CM40_CORYI|nr:hypothetical protein BT93_L1607 [Corymbia citriodora subsp. variegata]